MVDDDRYIRLHYPNGYARPSPNRLAPQFQIRNDVNKARYPPYLSHSLEEYEGYGGRRVYASEGYSNGQSDTSPDYGHRLVRQAISHDDTRGYLPTKRQEQRDISPLRRDPPLRRELRQAIKQPLVTTRTHDGKFLVKYKVRSSDDYQPKREQILPGKQEQSLQVSPKRQFQPPQLHEQKLAKIVVAPQKQNEKQKVKTIVDNELKHRSPKRKKGTERRKRRKDRRSRDRSREVGRRHRSKGERYYDEEYSSDHESVKSRDIHRDRSESERYQTSESREVIHEEYVKSKDSSNIVVERKRDNHKYSNESRPLRRRENEVYTKHDHHDNHRHTFRSRTPQRRPMYYPRRRQSTPFECIEIGLDEKPWFEHVNDAIQESCPTLNCDSDASDSDSETYGRQNGRQRYSDRARLMRRSDCNDQVVIPPWLLCCGGFFIASLWI